RAETQDEGANSAMQRWDGPGGEPCASTFLNLLKGNSIVLARPRRSKNRHSAPPADCEFAANSSLKVESGCSLTSPRINVVCSSSGDALPRPASAPLPVSRQCCHHLTAVLTAIRRLAPRRPGCNRFNQRLRKSAE